VNDGALCSCLQAGQFQAAAHYHRLLLQKLSGSLCIIDFETIPPVLSIVLY
jgi:hypothetical protein